MKRAIPATLFILFLFHASLAQLPPACQNPNPPLAKTCNSACILCDLDGYMSSTTQTVQGQQIPGYCTQVVHSMGYMGFVAGSVDLTIEVAVGNCSLGNSIEMGIFQTDDCQNFTLVSDCNTAMFTGNSYTFTNTEPLVPGCPYFLVFDNNGPAACQFTVTVINGSTAAPPVPDSDIPSGPTSVCPGATTVYTIPPIPGACHYQWTAPAGVTINGQSSPVVLNHDEGTMVTVTWGNQGGSICVKGMNPCFQGNPVCLPVSIATIPPTVLPEIFICPGSSVEWIDGNFYGNTQLLSTTFVTPLGCDSTVKQQLTVRPPVVKNLGVVRLCQGDCFDIGNDQYCNTGFYQEILTAASGCDSTVIFSILLVQTEANILAPDTLTCLQDTISLDGSGSTNGVEFSWFDPAGMLISDSAIIQVDTQGLYTLAVQTEVSGLVCYDTALITVISDLQYPDLMAEGDSLNCQDTLAQLHGSSASQGIVFQWNGPNGFIADVPDTTTTQPGIYILTGTAENGCISTDTATIAADMMPPILSIDVPDTLTCMQDTVQLMAVVNPAGSSLSWQGPQNFNSNGNNPSVVLPGIYVLTATGLNACVATQMVEVIADTIAPQVAGADTTVSCAQPSVSLPLSLVPATASVQWTGPGNFSSNLQNPVINIPGLYSVVATSSNGCTAAASDMVSADTIAPVLSASGGALNCTDTSTMLLGTVSPAGSLVQWTGPGNFSDMQIDPVVSLSGLYTITATGLNGCTATATYLVPIDTTAPQVLTVGGTLTCSQNDLMLSATVAPSGSSIQWTGPQNFNSNQFNPLVDFPGVYTATATAPNGCTASSDATVLVDATIPQVSVSGDTITCAQNTVTLGATVSPAGSTLQWSGPQNFSSSLLNPVVSAAGTYILTVSNSAGCTATASAVVVIDTIAPTLNPTGDTLTCTQQSVQLMANGAPMATSVLWTGPQNFSAGIPNPIIDVAGSYTVTGVLPNGCSAQATVVVPIDTIAPQLQLSGGTINCQQSSVQLMAGISPATSVLTWSGPQNFSSGIANPTVSLAGIYTLNASNPNGCTAQATVEVLIDTIAPVLTAAGGTIDCNSSTLMLSSTFSPGGTTLLWSGPQNFSSTEIDPLVSIGGTYTVTGLAPNGCSAQATAIVLIDTVAPQVSVTGGILTCLQNSLMLTATVSPGNSALLWSGPQNFSSTQQNPVIQTAGSYQLIATAQNGCSSSATAIVTADSGFPQVSVMGGTLTCSQTSVNLMGDISPANGTPSWMGPQNFSSSLQNPTVGLPGVYTLTVTTTNGCTASASVTVDIDTIAPQLVPSGGIITCQDPIIPISVAFSPAASQIFWTGPQNFQSGMVTNDVNISGTYSVLVTAPNGCSASGTAAVGIDTIAPMISGTGGSITCAAPILQLMATVSPQTSAILWTGPQNFSSTEATPEVGVSGDYTLMASAPNGCTASTTVQVISDISYPQVATADTVITCLEPMVNLSSIVSPSGSSLLWSGPMGFVSSSQTPMTGIAGTYTLTVTGSNGCSSSATATVSTDTLPPSLTVTGGAITCLENKLQLSALFSPAGSTIMWNGPNNFTASIPDPTVSTGGTYEATVIGLNGCTATASTTVEANNVPTWSLSLGPDLFVEEFKPAFLNLITDLSPNQTAGISWDFPTQVLSTNCTSCLGPAITLSESADISVVLTDVYGCSQTALIHIDVQQTSAIYVPNVFAPSGSVDNQVFQIHVGSEAHVAMFPAFRVFDRWGNLVHERLEFLPNDTSHGWDGTFRGDRAQPGVYVWYLEVEFENGGERFLKGDVTLVR